MWRKLRSFLGMSPSTDYRGETVFGTPPHDWRECRPAIVAVDMSEGKPVSAEERARIAKRAEVTAVTVEVIWARLRPADKQAFHRFSCLNSRAPEDLAVVEHLSDTLQAEVEKLGY